MQKTIVFIVFLFVPFSLISQTFSVRGEIADTSGVTVKFASVALLNPKDSTLVHFGITNNEGKFEISKIQTGVYLMQVACMGYQTFYQKLGFPGLNEDIGAVIIVPSTTSIGEVQVTGEKIPLLIKKDTVEYNAGAFKTNPDAVAEDLLKKLPGIEVDRKGNVKAMGEDVKKVMVDGKEFFSNDPKVATKNLPAESINKVQVYNKKSDESELLGIDDSEYDKTINFVLKDDMKKAVFGDVKAGTDFNEYYQGNAKVYRFSEKHQFAAIGMINNINKPGFSFQDYLDFNGGIRNMMSGGGGSMKITFDNNNSMPVDFGQTINGKLASGAAGINYSYELKKNNRVNISYLGNYTEKNLLETINTKNFTDFNSFEQNSDNRSDGSSRNHVFNFGWRNKSDSIIHYMLNGVVSFGKDNSRSNSFSENYSNNLFINSLDNITNNSSNQLNTTLNGSWMKKGFGNWKLLKFSGNVRYSNRITNSDWQNLTRFSGNPELIAENQYNNNTNNTLDYSIAINAMRRLAEGFYVEPSIEAGSVLELFDRQQGIFLEPNIAIDTLSPKIERNYRFVNPKLKFKLYLKKAKFNLGIAYKIGEQSNSLEDGMDKHMSVSSVLPEFSWDYEFNRMNRLNFDYTTSSNLPTASQLIPIIDHSNPLIIYYGNGDLKPEYLHNLFLSWMLFDQFSFTSVFAYINASYTHNKIDFAQKVDENLKQTFRLVNVANDYTVSANIQFSTPIKPLKMISRIEFSETWNQGFNLVNEINNKNTNFSHRIRLSFDNRKKEKWDIHFGGELNWTDAKYSIQKELNRKYFNYSAFSEIQYTPVDKWNFRISADITSYDDRSFGKKITVPLIGAEVSHYLMANKRATITVEVNDLLNKNTGISRTSRMNYLREAHSNVLGRHVMLSFKYKLNKFGNDGGIQIKTK